MVFLDIFGDVPDPRDFTARHDLAEVLFIALAAILCGATHCTEMAYFAQNRLDLLRRFIPLAHGAPSHDTFSRVLRVVDPQAFNSAFMRFMDAFGKQARIDAPTGQVAVDGKSLRRAYERGKAHMPPLVVTVYNCDTFMSLAQSLAGEGGEAQAAIEALKLLSLKGLTVTGDALHCHRRMTQTIREGGGDYVLAIKANQSALCRQANAALDQAAQDPATHIVEHVRSAHGRRDVRRAFVTAFTQTSGKAALVDLCAVGRIETWRTHNARTTHKVRCFALSHPMTAEQLIKTVLHHWDIENDLHRQLDILLNEDQIRGRKDNTPANHAILRRLTLNILRADTENIPLTHKRLKAAWDQQKLIRLLTHMR